MNPVYHTCSAQEIEKEVKSTMPDISRWLDSQGLQGWLETLPARLELPMFAGRVHEGGIFVEEVNGAFCRLFGIVRGEFPVTVEDLFEGKEQPVDFEPLREMLRETGVWINGTWEPVPGALDVYCLCRRDEKGRFLAVMEDLSERTMNRRLMDVRDSVLQMMDLYESRDLIRQILREMVLRMGIDWIGVFLWDEAHQRWMLSLDEAKDLGGAGTLRSFLSFAQQLGRMPDGPVPYDFAGLEVGENKRWTIPWRESAGIWKSLMEEAGVGSLSAGVLLTGSTPAVLLGLTRQSGGFARINKEVLATFWPVLVSLFERNRAVEGIASLYPKDPVTGLNASAMLKNIVSTEIERAGRYGYSLAFLILRVRNLAQLTEKGGAGMNDETLRVVARQVLGSIRNVDIAGRLGNSVLLLMPHTPADGAQVVAARLAERLKSLSPVPGIPLEVETETAVFEENGFEPRDFASRTGL
ncbi:MAG: GGDEF domain-containing protein [Thermovirgaceae bacterium]